MAIDLRHDFKALRKKTRQASRALAHICDICHEAADPAAYIRSQTGIVVRVLGRMCEQMDDEDFESIVSGAEPQEAPMVEAFEEASARFHG